MRKLSPAILLTLGLVLVSFDQTRGADAPVLPALTPASTLVGHDGLVEAAAFSPDGKLLATAARDLTVRLWETATGKEIAKLEGAWKAAAAPSLKAVAFSPDGSLVAACGNASNAIVWDRASKKIKQDIAIVGLGGGTQTLAISPDNATLAVPGVDANVALVEFFDLATGNMRASAKLKDSAVNLAYSHDGKMLACARGLNGGGDNIVVVDPASGNELFSLKDPDSNQVSAVAFSPDDKTLASSARWIKLWDVAARHETTKPHAPADKPKSAATWLAFTSDRKSVVYNGGGLTFGNPATAADVRNYQCLPSGARILAVSPDGAWAAAPSGRFVKLWKVADLKSPQGNLLLKGGKPTLPLGPKQDGAALVIEGPDRELQCLTFSPDAKRLYTVSYDATLRAWDTTTGKEQFATDIELFASDLFTIDAGKRLLFSRRILNAATGKDDGTLAGIGNTQVDQVVVAAAANIAAAPSSLNVFSIWDLPQPRKSVALRGTQPSQLALSADGKTIFAYHYSEPLITIYDTASGAEKGKIPAPDIRSFAATNDAKWLALATAQALSLVDVSTQKQVASFKTGTPILKPVFSPDGKLLVLLPQSKNKPVELLEVPSLKELATFNQTLGMPRAAFSPDGNLLAISDLDRIRVMKVTDAVAGK